MEARQPRLTLYLAQFVPANDRSWVETWQRQDRTGYRRLDQAQQWPDLEKSRHITAYGLRSLARSDPDRAWKFFQALNDHFSWSGDVEGAHSQGNRPVVCGRCSGRNSEADACHSRDVP